MKKLLSCLTLSALCLSSQAQSTCLLDSDWTFALGDASSMEADFQHGTEYFTYYCKARSTGGSLAPIMPSFDDSAWQRVSLPHDWAVDLPYSGEASHSHGYKCIGWKYPSHSVGWYRRHLYVPESEKGKQISIEFEGIFRDSQVFCNGFYLGHELSGYSSRVYTLTPYLNYGGDNVITVRCDASTEEGWYYEGAGIYRHVRLHSAGPVALKPYSLEIQQKKCSDGSVWTLASDSQPVYVDTSCINMQYTFSDASANPALISRRVTILDASGASVERAERPWSIEDPYLYTLKLELLYDGKLSDTYSCRFGVRTLEFSVERGLLVNGKPLKLKGCDLHLDHAGVGVGVPDEVWRYRIMRLKEFGFNAIRCSHNPASPSMLALCDELGMAVIDENRQFGVNEQLEQMRNMIERDRNHPCVFFWSVGNEEWALEHSAAGREIALRMSEFVHSLDLTRPTTYGNSGGPELVKGVDVFGYNYIRQNPVDDYHALFPAVCAVGTEETSGCGTRGVYETVPERGWMTPINRVDSLRRINIIEDGWKFYKARPWALGLFYWTGFDYRGEPNPMKWPATGSQFGILDYCGFPKDEAFYLKSVWTPEPTVHICGPYDGEVWVYSNCDEVRLFAGRKSLGVKKMPADGHLVWKVGDAGTKPVATDPVEVTASHGSWDRRGAVSGSGTVFSAVGYRAGRKVASDTYPSALPRLTLTPSKLTLAPDGLDVVVIDICTGLPSLEVSVENAELLGWGNGDPGFKYTERPAGRTHAERNSLTITPFRGYAQIIVRSLPLASTSLPAPTSTSLPAPTSTSLPAPTGNPARATDPTQLPSVSLPASDSSRQPGGSDDFPDVLVTVEGETLTLRSTL